MELKLPEWAVWLDVPTAEDGHAVRHRVLHGGRGGAKSWTIAHKLVEHGRVRKLRILCVREFQNSIRDSSKKLIEDAIGRLGMGASGDGFFTITEREIRGRNGTIFSFAGLNGRESAIKSLEGYDRVWIEEAATLSQASLDALIPTIRARNSELWWSYNPRFASDPVDQYFRGGPRPPGSIVREVQWKDSPWFPDVLRHGMEHDLRRDPEKHAHIWQGGYVQRSDAKVFNNYTVRPFEAPADAAFYFGADWGFSKDPTVLVRCFIGRWGGEAGASDVVADPNGRCLFIDFEAHKIGCSTDETPALFAGSDRRTPPRWTNPYGHLGIDGAATWQITADSARPETIDYMRKRGFSIVPASKGSGSIQDGIEFLRSYDIVAHERCRHLIDELIHYSWAVDRLTNQIQPRLEDKNNHVIDALRYALEGARKARVIDTRFASSGPRIMRPDMGFASNQYSDGPNWIRDRYRGRGLPY